MHKRECSHNKIHKWLEFSHNTKQTRPQQGSDTSKFTILVVQHKKHQFHTQPYTFRIFTKNFTVETKLKGRK